MPLSDKQVLLIAGGSIAVYKALDLVRRLRERGATVRCVLTEAAQRFVTPLAFGAVSGEPAFTDLFDRAVEPDAGHIRLARAADLVIVAPATADLIAKRAGGHADDLASAILLATDRPVLMAPAMNPAMWRNPAVRRNHAILAAEEIGFVGPESGEMAESGEAGIGRMAEPLQIVTAAAALLDGRRRLLSGCRIIVTSGPTHEPIDPVRYLANRSSGKQGHAIAQALAACGADVHLVSGPVPIADPPGVSTVHVQTAIEMQQAVEALLPADAAVFVAAVADWRVAAISGNKLKKSAGGPPVLRLVENPDILAGIGHHPRRPRLVIGFAAETSGLLENAQAKLSTKGADLIVANDVSPSSGVMGGDRNEVSIVSRGGIEEWPPMDKTEVARRLADLIAARLEGQ